MNTSYRRVVVLSSLVIVLTLTSALLLALAPAPLTPDASRSLFAIDTPNSLDVIFQTEVATKPGRWKYIYVHHTRSAGGNAQSLSRSADGIGEHFLIGNGDGCADGELQISQRWNCQLSAEAPHGASGIDPACISIGIIGDFDRGVPTPTQLRRLNQVVGALQSRLRIPASQVLIVDQNASPAGVGRYFPVASFREQLLP